MKRENCYDNYPYWIPAVSVLFQLSISLLGAVILFRLGLIWLILYLLYIAALEFRLLKKSCTSCYYYGKICFSAKGKLCALFFKKGDPERFTGAKITFKDILPDILVSVIPVVAGTVLLIMDFQWFLLFLIIVLAFLTFFGNGFIRGSLACRYCTQREIGCPAEQLFSKG
jgi:O-antigen ligase